MSLSHSDIKWYPRSQEDIFFIDRCREFPNVPLLGIKGGIIYNSSLALCQFGYARRDGPHELLMPSIIFDFQGDSDEQRRRFIRAWDRVHRSDPYELGPTTSLPMEPYLRWVRIPAQKLGMPYEVVWPIIVEVSNEEGVLPTILHPYIPTEIGALKRSWMQLREERDSY